MPRDARGEWGIAAKLPVNGLFCEECHERNAGSGAAREVRDAAESRNARETIEGEGEPAAPRMRDVGVCKLRVDRVHARGEEACNVVE